MNKINTFKQKISAGLLALTVLATGMSSCKKSLDINNVNPNTPSAVPSKYSLSAALSNTANLMYSSNNAPGYGGNQDVLDNWMGYWTQSGGYTASTTYVLYQLTSSSYTGNWDNAYLNLENYALIRRQSSDATQVYFKAISMIMTSFVYQRIVDLYNQAPYTTALAANSQFSYPYDAGSVIYKNSIARIDTALSLIKGAGAAAVNPSSFDVMFKGTMSNWTAFGNTLKLKMLMRECVSSDNGSIGDGGVKAALATNPLTGNPYVAADFLPAGTDALINPGYSSSSNSQENPLYGDIVANATGAPGINTLYFRANAYAVNFYYNNGDPRVTYFYDYTSATAGTKLPMVIGRIYGTTNTVNQDNSNISPIHGTGKTSTGAYKDATQGSPVITASESLFLQAEAIQRGYLTTYSSAGTAFNAAVAESFRFLGVTGATAAAQTYTSANNATAVQKNGGRYTNLAAAVNPIETIIVQKWASMNTIDPLESYSDWRRTGFPSDLPNSIYPGNQALHIPYRLPYPQSEISTNASNIKPGGTANDIFGPGASIFWMPTNSK